MTLEILLAEDHATFANSVSRFIGMIDGAHLQGMAVDGEDALEKALSLNPDVVLMDISMPKLSGFQVAMRLKAQARCPTIIFLSMHDEASYHEAALNAGGSYFVAKSNFVSELRPLIEKLVREQPPRQGTHHARH